MQEYEAQGGALIMFEKGREAAESVWPFYEEALANKVGSPVQLVPCTDGEFSDRIEFQVRTNDVRLLLITSFSLSKMPGTLWLYSHGAYVCEPWRKNGVGTLMNEFRQHIALEAGAWGLLAFVRGDNEPQRKLLENRGWKRAQVFWATDYTQELWAYQVITNFGRKLK